MNFVQLLAILFGITAIGGYLNAKFIRLPTSIGLLLFSTLLSVAILVANKLHIADLHGIAKLVSQVDFEQMLLHGVLSILLFAGSLHVNIQDLKNHKYSILSLSTLGVILATFLTGFIIYSVTQVIGVHIGFLYCLLFGALIAPTDAVTVLGILNESSAEPALKHRITGESLFNDGTGVVLFITILGLAFNPEEAHMSYWLIPVHLLKEIIGGAVIGFVVAWISNMILKTIDNYEVEITITIALALISYALAEYCSVSAPIATVVAGLVMGNKGRKYSMSDKTREHVDTFWELLDEIINSVLFVLIGLELVLINVSTNMLLMGVISIVAVLIARYFSIIGSSFFLIPVGFEIKNTPVLMTWGGLRGGISVALVLSLPAFEFKELLIAMTYMVVVFSIVVQGTTFGPLIKNYGKKHEPGHLEKE
jgi:CPA1 family monovalent cation:H+ antiporter